MCFFLYNIINLYDKSIVAYNISSFIDLKLVLDTVKQALKNVPYNQRKNLILHSDQGWHFTNYNNERLQEKIQELAPMQFRKQVLASLSF